MKLKTMLSKLLVGLGIFLFAPHSNSQDGDFSYDVSIDVKFDHMHYLIEDLLIFTPEYVKVTSHSPNLFGDVEALRSMTIDIELTGRPPPPTFKNDIYLDEDHSISVYRATIRYL